MSLPTDLMRRIAIGYAIALLLVTSLSYIPGLTDAEGRTFGLFRLNLYNDVLHTSSALWAALAAWNSRAASITFLKVFGSLYFLDGLLGVFTGVGFLDFGIFIHGPQPYTWMVKFLSSVPHLVLGGIAAFAGFKLAK